MTLRALPLATLVLVASCGSEPNAPAELSYADATEQAISPRFEEAYGVPLTSLECPDDLSASAQPATCTATLDGVTFDLMVKNNSADPASVLADWQAMGVLVREKTEADLADLLPTLAGGPVEVACDGDAVRLVAIDDTLSCGITNPETGETETATATVFTDDGRVRIATAAGEAATYPAGDWF
ncbi:hypothetical protein [Rubrivirga sp.]|uniref:hypothetical protein n=1 Tax=Rubrivirga sp. TaxID=1885344 RepID=UPI003C75C9B6